MLTFALCIAVGLGYGYSFGVLARDYSNDEIRDNYYYYCGVVTDVHPGGTKKGARGPHVDYRYNVNYSDIYGHKLNVQGTGSSPCPIDGLSYGDTIILKSVNKVALMNGIADAHPSKEDKWLYKYPVITKEGDSFGNDSYYWAKLHPESALKHYGLNCAYLAIVTDYKPKHVTFEARNFYGDIVTRTIRCDSAYSVGDTFIVSKNINDTLLPGFIIYDRTYKTQKNMEVLNSDGNGFIFHDEVFQKVIVFQDLPIYEDYYYERYDVSGL